jgi:hypothetical protein
MVDEVPTTLPANYHLVRGAAAKFLQAAAGLAVFDTSGPIIDCARAIMAANYTRNPLPDGRQQDCAEFMLPCLEALGFAGHPLSLFSIDKKLICIPKWHLSASKTETNNLIPLPLRKEETEKKKKKKKKKKYIQNF